jgi:hypothetical protein
MRTKVFWFFFSKKNGWVSVSWRASDMGQPKRRLVLFQSAKSASPLRYCGRVIAGFD